MVLFVFIIALLNPGVDMTLQRGNNEWVYGIVLGAVFAVLFGALLYNRGLTGHTGSFTPDAIAATGNVQTIGAALYTKFLFPVEVTSILLLMAAVGAVYLAMRKAE
jgi:NADH-quinone oxidoreductase subunit J